MDWEKVNKEKIHQKRAVCVNNFDYLIGIILKIVILVEGENYGYDILCSIEQFDGL